MPEITSTIEEVGLNTYFIKKDNRWLCCIEVPDDDCLIQDTAQSIQAAYDGAFHLYIKEYKLPK